MNKSDSLRIDAIIHSFDSNQLPSDYDLAFQIGLPICMIGSYYCGKEWFVFCLHMLIFMFVHITIPLIKGSFLF